eukprot:TRINITY_DN11786_c0_g8_i1.p1 TRINITY_DN11786_c0_g8~~TRINITY_DN11786_c0_g8_i1.p1  ORF type:complete len:1001 (-),score=105.97 TRINITY_DN11786_c0_g8_i1:279-3281(-)
MKALADEGAESTRSVRSSASIGSAHGQGKGLARALEALEALGPAGGGRLDAQASELRGRAEALCADMAAIEARADRAARRALARFGAGPSSSSMPCPSMASRDNGRVLGVTRLPDSGPIQEHLVHLRTLRGQDTEAQKELEVRHLGTLASAEAEAVLADLAKPPEPPIESASLHGAFKGRSSYGLAEIPAVPNTVEVIVAVTGEKPASVSNAISAQAIVDPATVPVPVALPADSAPPARSPVGTESEPKSHAQLVASADKRNARAKAGASNLAARRGPQQSAIAGATRRTVRASAGGDSTSRALRPAYGRPRSASPAKGPKQLPAKGTKQSRLGSKAIAFSGGNDAKSQGITSARPKRLASGQPRSERAVQAGERSAPSAETLKKIFSVIMRGQGILLSKEAFVGSSECRELRSALAIAFGEPVIQQSTRDLIDDMEYLWNKMVTNNCNALGEMSQAQFVKGFYAAMKVVPALKPESPRLNPAIGQRWIKLFRAWRVELADVVRSAPLMVLARLRKRAEVLVAGEINAGVATAELEDALVMQSKALEAMDFLSMDSSLVLGAVESVSMVCSICVSFGMSGRGAAAMLATGIRARGEISKRIDHRLETGDFSYDGIATLVECLLCIPAAFTPIGGGEESPQSLHVAALERRTLLRVAASNLTSLPLSRVADIVATAISVGCCDLEAPFLEAVAARLVGMGRAGYLNADEEIVACAPDQVTFLLHGLAQCMVCRLQLGGTVVTRAEACDSRVPDGAFLVPAQRLLNACSGRLPELSNTCLARLSCAMARLREGAFSNLLRQMEAEVSSRGSDLTPHELVDVLWGITSLGGWPTDMEKLLVSLANSCEHLDGSELSRVAASLGFRPANTVAAAAAADVELSRIWAALRLRIGSLAADELVSVACATVRLGLRDDAIMDAVRRRSQLIGPFDRVGASDMQQTLEGYQSMWGGESNRKAVVSFEVAAARHTGAGPGFAAQSLLPPSLKSQREVSLREALRPIVHA